MRKEEFINIIGELDEKYVEEAQTKRKKPSFRSRWSALAACFAVVLVIGAVTVLHPKGDVHQDDPLAPINLVEYQGAYYEGVDMNDHPLLDRYNLPHAITEDMIGQLLGKVKGANGEDVQQNFYLYAPYEHIQTSVANDTLNQKRPQRAVYLLEKDGVYTFALFCNFISFDSNTHTEASEMFALYGADAAEDIASVTVDGEEFTDSETINGFFTGLCCARSMGNDDFQNLIFGGKSEEEQQMLSTELAESAMEISIITTEGLAIHQIVYYPTINIFAWGLSYYQL